MSDQTHRRAPFWLIASLLVNMLLIGVLGGFLLRGGHGERGHRGGPPIAADASPEDVAAVRGVMRNAYEATRPHRDARRAARRELTEALALEPYDGDAVAATLETVRLAEQTMQTAMNEALSAQLASLTPRQRAGVAEAITRGPRGRRGRRGSGERRRDRRPTGE